jgi:hypothetical protein
MRSGAELEQHRREPERRDGTGHRGPLVGELSQRRAHEDAQPLVRRPYPRGPVLSVRHVPVIAQPAVDVRRYRRRMVIVTEVERSDDVGVTVSQQL